MRIETTEIIKKFEKEISEINKNGIHYSMLLYVATKKFFVAINKLDTQELSEYLTCINKKNINDNKINLDIVNYLVALIIAEYTHTDFLRNFLNDYTKVKPNSVSEWKIVRLLQLIGRLFKSEKIEIDSAKANGLAEVFERVSQALKNAKHTKGINKHIVLVKKFSADLAVIIQKIFLLEQQPQQASVMKQEYEVPTLVVGSVLSPSSLGVSVGNNNTSTASINVAPPPPPPLPTPTPSPTPTPTPALPHSLLEAITKSSIDGLKPVEKRDNIRGKMPPFSGVSGGNVDSQALFSVLQNRRRAIGTKDDESDSENNDKNNNEWDTDSLSNISEIFPSDNDISSGYNSSGRTSESNSSDTELETARNISSSAAPKGSGAKASNSFWAPSNRSDQKTLPNVPQTSNKI